MTGLRSLLMEMSNRRRRAIARDGPYCRYCGEALTVGQVRLDHVLPRSRGGPDSLSNRVVACYPCDSLKGDWTLTELGWVLREAKGDGSGPPVRDRQPKNGRQPSPRKRNRPQRDPSAEASAALSEVEWREVPAGKRQAVADYTYKWAVARERNRGIRRG